MDESINDVKPSIGSGDEPNTQTEDLKPTEVTDKSEEAVDETSDQKSESEGVSKTDDKDPEPAEDKMEVETSVVETAAVEEPKPAESEPAVDDSVVDDQSKGVEPSVEPVPEVGVKSPSDINVGSPAPAVQSSTPPRSQSAKKPKVDLTTVPVRQYLDTTVVPILLQGLSALARERPQKPIAFLANFLLEKASEYDE